MTTTLGNVSVGSIVTLNENGSPQNYIVVQQGKPSELYDDSCNGTWLLRQDVYNSSKWGNNDNTYATSKINSSYLPDTILPIYDKNIQTAIIQVKIPYVNGTGIMGTVSSGSNGLPCKIFLLSGLEVGFTQNVTTYLPTDGAKLSYFDSGFSSTANNKRIAKYNGLDYSWWLRSPYTKDAIKIWYVNSYGEYGDASWDSTHSVRPALVLPYNLLVDDNNAVIAIDTPNITVPLNAMMGQFIPISWTAVDGATNYQLQRNTGSGWSTIYTGSNLAYQDTAGSWSTVQYQVAAQVDGVYGPYGQSNQIPIILASTLAISGTNGDLGIITKDIGYTVTSDTGNQISLTRTINNIQVASLTVNSGFTYNIPIADLPTGEGNIVITASVQSSAGLVTATRNWTYTKTSIDFSSTGGIAQLTQNKQNIWPVTVSDAVEAPAYLGGNLNAALNILSQAALYKTSPNEGLYDILGNSLLSLPITPGTQIATGSYVGTGKYGSSNPNSLTFEFEPKILIIPTYISSYGFSYSTNFCVSNATKIQSGKDLTWYEGTSEFDIHGINFSGNKVEWYSEDDASSQLNESGYEYTYIIIG